MGKQSSITDEQLQEMVKLYQQGLSMKDISILLGVSYNAVAYQLRKAGKIVRRRNTYTAENKLKAKRLLLQGKTYKEVSNITGISIAWLKKGMSHYHHKKAGVVYNKYPGEGVPCRIYDCNDRKECMDKDEPQNCLVWQLVYGRK